MVGRRIVHFSPDSRICSSAISRTLRERAGSLVVTAVVEMKTARSTPAARAAATMAGACPKPSDAILSKAEHRAELNTPGSPAGSSKSPDSGSAPCLATAAVAVSLRARATTSVPAPPGLVQDVPAEEATAPGNQQPHSGPPARSRILRYSRASAARS